MAKQSGYNGESIPGIDRRAGEVSNGAIKFHRLDRDAVAADSRQSGLFTAEILN
jgi:hypothetical protein